MKKHTFNQEEILSTVHHSRQWERWAKFTKVVNELGYSIRVTGGNYLTHEINTTEEEFEVIKDIVRGK